MIARFNKATKGIFPSFIVYLKNYDLTKLYR